MSDLIYIASPYTHESPIVRDNRYRDVLLYTKYCLERGEPVFSPIVHNHNMVKFFGGTIEVDAYKEWILSFLDRTTELRVLKIPGWAVSEGIAWEREECRDRGIPEKLVFMPEIPMTPGYFECPACSSRLWGKEIRGGTEYGRCRDQWVNGCTFLWPRIDDKKYFKTGE